MAVVNSIALGKARNSAGNLTFQVYNGQTIAREKPVSVSNPRTPAQLAQRARMTNLVAAWRNQFAALKRFFTVKGQRESEFNAFTRLNMPYASSPFVDDTGAVIAAPAGMYLTSGNYPEHFISAADDAGDTAVTITNAALQELVMENDQIVVIPDPTVSGEVSFSVYTLSDVEAASLAAGNPVTTDIPYTATDKVLWYSPSRRLATTVRM